MTIDGEPSVRLWTNAPINSPMARQWLNDIVVGKRGIKEIKEIHVGKDYVIVEMDGDIVTSRESAKKVITHLMKLIKANAEELDEFDLERWRSAATPMSITSALAVSSETKTPEWDGS